MRGILVKNRLSAVFASAFNRSRRGREIKKATISKIVIFAFLYLFVVATFLFLSVSTSYLLASMLLPNAGWLYYLILMLLSLSVIFVFSIFETKAELFECKDNDLLLSMPINPSDIVIARIFVVLIYNYIIDAIIMLPAIVFYGIFAGNAFGVIGGILMFLLVPFFATALASLVGYLVAEMSRKIKYKFKNLMTVIFTFAFVFLYFTVFEVLGNNLEELIKKLASMSAELSVEHKFLYFLGNAALLNPLSALSVAVVSVVSALIAYILISRAYIRIVTYRSGVQKDVYKEKRLKKRSALIALTSKDIRHFFSSPIYIMNGGMGLIMSIGVGVFVLIKRSVLVDIAFQLSLSDSSLATLAVALVGITLSMSIISACALSIEGREFWITQTMPIQPRTVLLSKALMQFVISAPPILISTLLIVIAIVPSLFYIPFYILSAQIINLMFSLMGILINVAFPKFDYDNEAQVIKQSLATLISMFSCMLLSVGIFIGVIILSMINEMLGIVLILGAPIVVVVVEVLLLLYPASKRYKHLNM